MYKNKNWVFLLCNCLLPQQYPNFTNFVISGDEYACDVCGRVYRLKRSLWRHKNFECQTQPRFRCDICQHPFKHKYHLNQHMIFKHDRTWLSS